LETNTLPPVGQYVSLYGNEKAYPSGKSSPRDDNKQNTRTND
jgi:hypothetical protein